VQLENGTADPRDSDPSASSAPPKPEGKLFQINNICKDEEARAVDAGWFCA
jgi:hypothetical protein